MKILTLDIETRPSLGYIWGLWEQNVGLSQIEEHGDMFSFAAKWHGEKKVYFSSVYHDGKRSMLHDLFELLDEADVVVGYNSKRFDVKHIQAEFWLNDMGRPSPFQQIDLLQVVKKQFRFLSNKLDYVAQRKGLGKKTPHTGFDLWLGCMRQDPKAWKLMRRYNMQDVRLTEELYLSLLEWIDNHPHRGLYSTDWDPTHCPRCGHDHTHIRKYTTTASGRWKTRQCQKCKGYFKAEPAADDSKIASVRTKAV